MKKWFLSFLCVLLVILKVNAQEKIDLSGYWWYTTDRISDPSALVDKVGERISLPNSILANGKGSVAPLDTKRGGLLNDASYFYDSFMSKSYQRGEIKLSSLPEPEINYVGSVWYWKSFFVPKGWKKSRIIFFLGRPHIKTTVYVNGKAIGHSIISSLPHQCDVTPYLTFGSINQIAIKVDNEIRNLALSTSSHFASSVFQNDWNGVGGKIELQARAKQTVLKVRIGKYDEQKHSLQVFLQGDNGFDKGLKFLLEDSPVKVLDVEDRPAQEGLMTREYHLLCFLDRWDDSHPNTYELSMVVKRDTLCTFFGIRDISVKEGQCYINGHYVSFHGAVVDRDFSLTASLSTNVDFWFDLFRHYKEFGVNAIRFHGLCPPEAAFTAADCLGFYLEMESSSLLSQTGNSSLKIPVNIIKETKRIVDIYGNHPSLVMIIAPKGTHGKSLKKEDDWIKAMDQYDPRRIYCEVTDENNLAWNYVGEGKVNEKHRELNVITPVLLER
jgi:beta-galactosidase/beta-glucuronidase